jgi:hypothetical protein
MRTARWLVEGRRLKNPERLRSDNGLLICLPKTNSRVDSVIKTCADQSRRQIAESPGEEIGTEALHCGADIPHAEIVIQRRGPQRVLGVTVQCKTQGRHKKALELADKAVGV